MAVSRKERGLLSFIKARPTIQTIALLAANAYYFSFLRWLPCGYLQCSNCVLSTFTCPLILIQRGAVLLSMGMFGMMSAKIIGSIAAATAMLVFLGALFGSWACGWLCPFGFVQDLLARIPVPKFRLPNWSGIFRIPIFVGLVIAVPYLTGSLFFCDICPSGAINRSWQQAADIPLFFKTPEGMLATFSLIILAVVIASSIFVRRPFCSLLCPIGGIHGLFNRISGIFLKVDRDGCVDCGRCQKACPQGLNPVKSPAHSQCSRCLECTKTCKFISLDIRI
jgi:polyferredoxin